jgi:hypothetical protein
MTFRGDIINVTRWPQNKGSREQDRLPKRKTIKRLQVDICILTLPRLFDQSAQVCFGAASLTCLKKKLCQQQMRLRVFRVYSGRSGKDLRRLAWIFGLSAYPHQPVIELCPIPPFFRACRNRLTNSKQQGDSHQTAAQKPYRKKTRPCSIKPAGALDG